MCRGATAVNGDPYAFGGALIEAQKTLVADSGALGKILPLAIYESLYGEVLYALASAYILAEKYRRYILALLNAILAAVALLGVPRAHLAAYHTLGKGGGYIVAKGGNALGIDFVYQAAPVGRYVEQ